MLDSFLLFSSLFSHPALSLLTFFLGLLVGHRTALWRDLRKEFNDAAAPIRAWLLSEAQSPGTNYYSAAPGVVEIDHFVQRLHWWQRKGFLAAWEQQRAARKQPLKHGPMGGAGYSDPAAVVAAVKSCLAYTAPR